MDALNDARWETAGNGEEKTNQQPQSSLFPLFPLPSEPSSSFPETSLPVKWLSNPSFTFDVSAVSAITAASISMVSPLEELEEEAARPRNSSYDPVPSPSSSESERFLERKEKRRRRKKKERDSERSGDEFSRKSGVRAWIGSYTKPSKNYCFDVHADRDNLAFGCLYKMDIAQYKLQNYSNLSEFNFELPNYRRRSIPSLDVEHDLDLLDTKLITGRYYSVKFSALEKRKDFKRVKIVETKPFLIPGEYIPLTEIPSTAENGSNDQFTDSGFEESREDEFLRRTRELNKMSREFPHDEKAWLAFAEFQDKIASTQPQRAARLQTLEKKTSILEKAVELNPDNEELLLCLLKSYQERDTAEAIAEKWEKVLVRHYDSVALWKEYLLLRQGDFSHFKVSDIRKAYGHAIQALSSACSKLCRQHGYQDYILSSVSSSLVQLELGLVDIFVNLCIFEWQTGHQELATGLFQAEIEYSLFCPSLLLSYHSKQKLFEQFWNSNCARTGEDGALGWSAWMEKEEQVRQDNISEQIEEESEEEWPGWKHSFPVQSPIVKEESSMEALNADNGEDNPDIVDISQENDVEALLKKLGIDANADPFTEVKDTVIWKKWSLEELSRDSAQWLPIREDSDTDRNGHLSRVILFEDVNEYLFSLRSNEARQSLLFHFIDFFGGKISPWTSTNSASWTGKTLSSESLKDSIIEDLKDASNICNRTEHSAPLVLESLLECNTDIIKNASTIKFLRNAILLCLNAFPRNHAFEEALLALDDSYFALMSAISSAKPRRALARSMLKKDRQNLLLCGIYARSEAATGNIDTARKIFDMALSSANELPTEFKELSPLIYLWYAEMELDLCNSGSDAMQFSQRAMHILTCLGGDLKYCPFVPQSSSVDILKARLGFKEKLKSLRSLWAHGDVRETSVALVRSAFIFELLTAGPAAGIQIIEEAFSMALPERSALCLHLESLWVHQLKILQKHAKKLGFSRLRAMVARGLQMYPYNPKSFCAMVESYSLFASSHEVRRIFDECMQRKPSVIACLFALEFELGKFGTSHRVYGLFEKALSNDQLHKSTLLWRCYLAYEIDIKRNSFAAKRVFFRAIHACPWAKRLWLEGFQKLSSILTAKELSDLQDVMREKELNLRTDIYEILLEN